MANSRITQVLKDVVEGSDSAVARLMPLVYDELRALSESYLKQERPDHTLSATALVHEAYLRLVDQREVEWQNRAHFFAVAAQAIRRILVDHARAHLRAKRGGDWQRITLDEQLPWIPDRQVDLVALDESLSRLAALEERHARVIELRFFGGLTVVETAAVLHVSERTVKSDWRMARAWLMRDLGADQADGL